MNDVCPTQECTAYDVHFNGNIKRFYIEDKADKYASDCVTVNNPNKLSADIYKVTLCNFNNCVVDEVKYKTIKY